MLSPSVITELSPTLDGILFEALRQRAPLKTNAEILDTLKTIVAFNEALGVYHCSSLRFGVTPKESVVALNYCRTDYLHEGKRSSDMFAPNGVKGKYKQIVVAGGPTKKRMSIRPAYAAPFALFDVYGDANAIVDLLKNTFVGIGYDAQNAGMGHFDTESIEVTILPEDVSLVEAGQAKRPLPAGAAGGLHIMANLRPPYYENHRVPCSAPERIVITNIFNI
jgi:hypothetical protein